MKQKRGLASADEETRRRVAQMGGRAAQASGRAHRLTKEERIMGGRHSSGSFDKRPHEEVQEIGRKGGRASQGGGRPRKK